MNTRTETGFTLLEMMIVILIVGILSAIAMATYVGVQNMGYDTDSRSNIYNSITGAKAYYTSHDSSYNGLNAVTLAEEVAGINFKDGADPVTAGVVYIYGVSENEFTLKCKSQSDRVFTAEGNRLTVTADF